MAERRNYRGARNRPMPVPFKDLRELLNMKKQQRELEEQEGRGSSSLSRPPPPDPPSLLRDSLRGDETLAQRKDEHRQDHSPRGRGYFRRRGRGSRNFSQNDRSSPADKSLSNKLFTCNIIVEVSTETGQRTCTIENENLATNPNSDKRENFHSRGSFRGRRRGRGNYRGQYYYRGQNRRYNTASKDTAYDNRKSNTDYDRKKNYSSTKQAPVPKEENWDSNDAKYNKIEGSFNNQFVEHGEEENWDNDFISKNLKENVTDEDKQDNVEDEDNAIGVDEHVDESEQYAAEEEEQYYYNNDDDYEGSYDGENYEITGYSASEYEHAKDDEKTSLQSDLNSKIIDSNSQQIECDTKNNVKALKNEDIVDVERIDKHNKQILENKEEANVVTVKNDTSENNLQKINTGSANEEKSSNKNQSEENVNNNKIINKEDKGNAICSEDSKECKIDDKNQEKALDNKNLDELNKNNITKDVAKEITEETLKSNDGGTLKDCDNLDTLKPSSEEIINAKK